MLDVIYVVMHAVSFSVIVVVKRNFFSSLEAMTCLAETDISTARLGPLTLRPGNTRPKLPVLLEYRPIQR